MRISPSVYKFDAEAAEAIDTASGQTLHLHRQVCEDGGEVRLNGYSEERAQKVRNCGRSRMDAGVRGRDRQRRG